MLEYTIEQMAETVWFYKFTETNKKGENIIVELSKCFDNDSKNSLPKSWAKSKFIDRVLETYWSINTFVKDTEGRSWEKYNPQIKPNKCEINFDWMFEATEHNKELLINEVYRQFSTATGETATEAKYRKVKEYAETHNYDVVTEMPEGWIEIETMTAPIGSTLISNMKINIQTFRDKNRKEALLLI